MADGLARGRARFSRLSLVVSSPPHYSSWPLFGAISFFTHCHWFMLGDQGRPASDRGLICPRQKPGVSEKPAFSWYHDVDLFLDSRLLLRFHPQRSQLGGQSLGPLLFPIGPLLFLLGPLLCLLGPLLFPISLFRQFRIRGEPLAVQTVQAQFAVYQLEAHVQGSD